MSSVFDQTVSTQANGATGAYLPNGKTAHHVVVLDVGRQPRSGSRFLNVVIALVGLALLSPFLLIIAALVKLTSRGPAFYTQTRVGIDRRSPWKSGGDRRRKVDYGGRLFRIYKFRTMVANPSANLQVWADQNDKRVTRLGRILRRYRLDEIPQLFNVLKGDMNVVGPRPEQPNIFVDLRTQIQGYSGRQQVLPGITGLAQINLKYDSCLDDVKRKLQYDLEYIDRQTPITDLRIMLQTIPVVLLKRGGW
ncbi:MAG: sugar transferase [Longimicrobiales bacterium]